MMEKEATQYFEEVAHCLDRAGIQTGEASGGFLPVLWGDQLICEVNRKGIMYWNEVENSEEIEQIKKKVYSTVNMVSEYVGLMEQAPQISASGLDGDYRTLAEFNNVVLAGHQTRFGMEFVTWEWMQNHTALWQGHYYGDDYDAAKQDFIGRSGLLPQERIFNDQQLVEMYRCVHETLDSEYPITEERKRCLEEAVRQIEYAVPNLDELMGLSNQKELEIGFQQNQTM